MDFNIKNISYRNSQFYNNKKQLIEPTGSTGYMQYIT